MKRVLVILIILSLVFSMMVPIVANAQKDSLFLSSGKTLETLGVLEGSKEGGDLMLDKILNRQDMVVLISRLYKEETKAKTFLVKPNFTDVTDQNYIPYIGWSVDKGLIKGMGNNVFGFGQNTTVHQFQSLLMRVLGYDEESALWPTVPELAVKLGIMEGLENNYQDSLSRGQMAVMTLNTLKLTKKGSSITLAEVLNLNLQ